MKAVLTNNAPMPKGHYSQAIVYQGLVYISGILPQSPHREKMPVSPIETQLQQILDNLYSILIAAGSEIQMVIKTTIYISDISLWDKVDSMYAHFFGIHRPARTIVPSKQLHYGFDIEMDAIAAINE